MSGTAAAAGAATAQQLMFSGLQPRKRLGRARPAICVVCGRFHMECRLGHWRVPNRKATGAGVFSLSKKKKPICPICAGNPVRYPVGPGLVGVGPTTVDIFAKGCPRRAGFQGGPTSLKVRVPQTRAQLVGAAAHLGLQKSVERNCTDRAVRGQYGIGGFIGERLLKPTGRGVAVATIPDAQKIAKEVWEIVSYARRHGLVLPVTTRKNANPDLIFAQTEQSLRITLRTLLEWAGVGWESLAGPRFDGVLQGRIDLLEAWKVGEGYRVLITDYKTYLPSATARYHLSKSLQMRLYGLWAAWAFGVPLKNVELQLLFIGEKSTDGAKGIGHETLNVHFDSDDPQAALREVWRFLAAYHRVENAGANVPLEVAQTNFPPDPDWIRCFYCGFREKHCPEGKAIVEGTLTERKTCWDCGTKMYWDGTQYRCPNCRD